MKNQYIFYLQFLCLPFLTNCTSKQIQKPSIIEIIDMDYRFSTNKLIKFCKDNKVNSDNIYEWQNHWLLYNPTSGSRELLEKIEDQFPRLKVNFYDKPFYNFNREKQTGEKPVKEWVNIIMTANLVKDSTLQSQYMEYHRTQFKKWPEISKGFSNADFQQLLVFRTGRQLMLVISIPKGKTLDELNPKTTENNPRVEEWNKIMSQFQEGIDDAPKGEVWVMFKPIKN